MWANILTKKAATPEQIRLRLIKLYGGPSELKHVSMPQALLDLATDGYENEALAIKAKWGK